MGKINNSLTNEGSVQIVDIEQKEQKVKKEVRKYTMTPEVESVDELLMCLPKNTLIELFQLPSIKASDIRAMFHRYVYLLTPEKQGEFLETLNRVIGKVEIKINLDLG